MSQRGSMFQGRKCNVTEWIWLHEDDICLGNTRNVCEQGTMK
jgi:hypothetical protein